VTAVVAHHALGQARGAGSVKDIEGVRGGDGDTGLGLGGGHRLVPTDIATFDHGSGLLGPPEHNAALRLVLGHLNGLIQQGLVVDHPVGLDATGTGNHDLGLGILDTCCQFAG